jgi:VCBS repeat-containing protein
VDSNPSHGTLTLNSDGSFSYTPAANYNGPDSFTYHANDGTADSNIATVNITLNPANDAPVAVNDSYSTNEDTTLNVAAPGVLTNDTDVEGDTLTAVVDSSPSHGTLTLNSDGSFSYTPAANYNGADSFTYHANDGAADSNIATVSLTINPVNDAPAFTSTPVTAAAEGVAYAYAVTTTDPDLVYGDRLTITAPVKPAWLTLTDHGNGTASLGGTPSNADVGDHAVTLQVRDTAGATDSQSFTITVTSGNLPPIADAGPDQQVKTNSLVTLDGRASTDPDGNLPLSFGWTQIGGTAVSFFNRALSVTTFTAPATPQVLTFTLTVTDSLGLASTTPDTVVLTVRNYYIYLPVIMR